MRSVQSLSLCVGVVVASIALGDQVQIQPDRDNTIFSESEFLSGGASPYLFAGTNSASQERRGLVRFDIAGSVPAGSTINSVSFRLEMNQSMAGSTDISLHALNQDWGEGASVPVGGGGGGGAGGPAMTDDVTWSNRFFGQTTPWTPGGDFNPAASASTTVGSFGLYDWSSAQMAADVQAWLDGTSSNFGWIMVNNSESVPSAKRFNSGDQAPTEALPTLTIDFTTGTLSCPCEFGGNPDTIDVNDLLAFLSLWFDNAFSMVTPGTNGDFNGDGTVDVLDILGFLSCWFPADAGAPCP